MTRLLGRVPHGRRAVAVAALVLASLIFVIALRTGSASEPATIAYAIPVTLMALAFGTLPGVALAICAGWLYWIAAYVDGTRLSFAQLIYRQGALVFLAVIVSVLASRLAATERNAQRLLEVAHEGVWAIDLEGRTTYANRRLAELFRTTIADVMDSPATRWVGEGDILADRLERRRRGLSEQYETRFLRADGTELWALVSASPLTDTRGRVQGALALLSDLTDRRRAEEELRRASAQIALQRELRHRAVELNDAVVQGLALARYLLARGDHGTAAATIEATLGRAKELVADLIGDVELEAGALRRESAATLEQAHDPST